MNLNMANTSEDPAVDLYVIRIGSEEYVARRLHDATKDDRYPYMVYGFEGTTECFINQHKNGVVRQLSRGEALIHDIKNSER